MRCPNCGQDNPAGARFCFSCGRPFEQAAPREERKVVTVLFADLVGFTSRAEQMDPEDVRALLAPYHQRLRSELERFGGTVEKFIGDAVVALFGAPVSHEDDPERAVRAALAIRDWVREEEADLQLRIAVNTGEALIALGARPEAGEGMASGDVVNTTARLQSAAPVNGILVGEATWRATRDRIDYREHDPVEAKGKATPVSVWEAMEARSRLGMDLEQRSLTPLVGRERELAMLFDTFDRVHRDREPQLLTLVGVPGIGKSRLVAELFQRIDNGPNIVRWRQGRALPYGAGVSYWALSEMVKAQAGMLENDSDAEVARKLRDSATELVEPHEADWVVHHLESLVGIGEEATDRAAAFAAWLRYFEALAEERTLVLVFEDLHWADDGLLDFVDHLADRSAGVPLLILATTRPELLDRRQSWSGGKLNASTLALSPLGDADAARVLGAVLEQQLLPADLQQTLLERAGGNPLYAEQFARLYLEHGSLEGLAAPENVQGIIAARVDALPPAEKTVLQDASVLGKIFWSGGVASLAGLPADELDASLHALVRKGFIRRERRSAVAGESEFAFRHVLVREVGYGQVPRPARAAKHVAAAAWIESLGRVDDHAELLAHHYTVALELAAATGQELPGLHDRARLALRSAGDRAALLSSHPAAVGFYSAALDLWPSDGADRARLLYALGRAEYNSGDASGRRLDEARDALLASGLPDLAAEAEALAAEAAWHRGERDELDRRIAHALELIGPQPDSPAKAWISSQVARYAMLAGDYDRALDFGARALELAERFDLPEVRVHALNNVGSAKERMGRPDGVEDLESSVSLARRINSPELARSLNNLGSTLFMQGHTARCLELELETIVVAERFGLESLLLFTRGNVIGSYLRLGRWDEVIEAADALIAEQPPLSAEAGARGCRAWVRAARGDLAGAVEDSTWVLDAARRRNEPQTLLPALATCAYVFDLAGEERRSREFALELLEHIAEDAALPIAAPGEIVDLLVRIAGRDRVLSVFERSTVTTEWLTLGRILGAGDFERAAGLYREHAAPADAAVAQVRAAEQLLAAGRSREADLYVQEALAFYRSVDAKLLAQRAERLLAASA